MACDILRLDSYNHCLIQYAFIEQHSIGPGDVRLFLSKVRLIVAKRRWSVFMSEIIDQFYTPLLIEHGFIRDPDNQQYGALGDCWKLSPEVGEGSYWTYGQKDLSLGMTLFPGRNYLHTVGCLPVVSKHLLEATLHTRL